MTRNGSTFDRNVVENSDRTDRQYIGLTTQGSYNFGPQVMVGANYTLSHAQGSLEGETAAGGPSGALANNYPEYRQASWNYPEGDLAIDQRHRREDVGDLQRAHEHDGRHHSRLACCSSSASGVPFPGGGAGSDRGHLDQSRLRDASAADRVFLHSAAIAFRTEATYRTDLAVNYGYRFGQSNGFRPELFFHGEMLNVFNQFQAVRLRRDRLSTMAASPT